MLTSGIFNNTAKIINKSIKQDGLQDRSLRISKIVAKDDEIIPETHTKY
jgi:hypothetical protein